MSKQYDLYLKKHVANVQKAFELLSPYLIKYQVMDVEEIEKMKGMLEKHDTTKFGRDEYEAYDKHYFGSELEKRVSANDYKVAWLHHIHTNRHHWQHYIIPCGNNDGTNEVIEMPLNCVIEMICDWWSFGLAKKEPCEILDWYSKNKNKIVLHPETKKMVTQLMYLVNCYLTENKRNKYM